STTSSSIAATGVTVSTQAVQYVTTGIILTVSPTINTSGLLTLNISLEDSEAQTNTTSSIGSPLITTQNLTTTVVASTSQTILLGGMMSDSLSDSEIKVPLVGDIPLIGNLFKTRSKGKTKTELIIMLTPHILTSSDQAAKITDEIKKGIKWLQ
ncbi:MAG: type II secretion system protein GspD, partial [Dissulfurispiraceae bacterium]